MTITRSRIAVFVLVALFGSAAAAAQHGVAPTSAANATPAVYGVDLEIDASWLDGEKYPSTSPNNPGLQAVRETLAAAGYNVLRIRPDLRDPETATVRLANLCAWAGAGGIKLVVALNVSQGGSSPSDAARFVRSVVSTMRAGALENYTHILAFQLADAAGTGAADALARQAAALRAAEQEALSGTGLDATPILVETSFDAELSRAVEFAGAAGAEERHERAYLRLQQSLDRLATSPTVDIVGVRWVGATSSAEAIDRLTNLLGRFAEDLRGKPLVFTTGFSNAFQSAEEQQSFCTLVLAQAAGPRTDADSPFLGMIFHGTYEGDVHAFGSPQPGQDGMAQTAGALPEAALPSAVEQPALATTIDASAAGSSPSAFRQTLIETVQSALSVLLETLKERLSQGGSSENAEATDGAAAEPWPSPPMDAGSSPALPIDVGPTMPPDGSGAGTLPPQPDVPPSEPPAGFSDGVQNPPAGSEGPPPQEFNRPAHGVKTGLPERARDLLVRTVPAHPAPAPKAVGVRPVRPAPSTSVRTARGEAAPAGVRTPWRSVIQRSSQIFAGERGGSRDHRRSSGSQGGARDYGDGSRDHREASSRRDNNGNYREGSRDHRDSRSRLESRDHRASARVRGSRDHRALSTKPPVPSRARAVPIDPRKRNVRRIVR
jgi:hypothetical protein